MIIHKSDSNAILYQPVRNKESGSNVKVWTDTMQRLAKCGIKPKHQMMDNEVSAEWKEAIKEAEMTYQLGKIFPIQLWDRLLPQAETTLNMLRPARVARNVSPYAYMHGQHNFNAYPLAPLGMEVEVHLKPDTRETWQEHSASWFNVGASFEHYRCYEVWIKNPKSVRLGDTVFFKHKYLTMPTIMPGDAVLKAAEDLKQALPNNMPKNSETEKGINQLIKIFHHQYEVQKLPKSKERAERLRAATQEAETQFNAQIQRVVNKTTPDEEAEASQRVVTEASHNSAAKAPMQVSQDEDSDEDTAESIISYPGRGRGLGENRWASPEHKVAAPNQNHYLRMHAGYIRNK